MSSRAVASSSMTRTRSAMGERRPSELLELLACASTLPGRRTVKTEPLPGSLVTVTSPPIMRELARDGKAEPRAAEALSGRGIGLGELLEQLRLLLRGHANTGVSDRELDPVATVGDPARPQPDLAFLGELAGIAQQVEQYLPQPHGVHGQRAEVVLGVNDEAVLVLLGKLSSGADDLVDQRC